MWSFKWYLIKVILHCVNDMWLLAKCWYSNFLVNWIWVGLQNTIIFRHNLVISHKYLTMQNNSFEYSLHAVWIKKSFVISIPFGLAAILKYIYFQEVCGNHCIANQIFILVYSYILHSKYWVFGILD